VTDRADEKVGFWHREPVESQRQLRTNSRPAGKGQNQEFQETLDAPGVRFALGRHRNQLPVEEFDAFLGVENSDLGHPFELGSGDGSRCRLQNRRGVVHVTHSSIAPPDVRFVTGR